MIECPKCSHDNDIGRIFCVKCGEKLEISKVGAPSGMKRASRKAAHGKSFAKVAAFLAGKVAKVAILALTTAVLTLVFLPPNFESKGFSTINFDSCQTKRGQVEDAVTSQAAVTVTFTEAEINAAMAKLVETMLAAAGEVKGPRLESVYLSIGNGTVTATIQRKWKWFRLSTQMRYVLQTKDDHFQFVPEHAWIGRFSLPPQVNDKIAELLFKIIPAMLETERKWSDSTETLEIKPGNVTITTKKAPAS